LGIVAARLRLTRGPVPDNEKDYPTLKALSAKRRYMRVVGKFLATWMGFIVVLIGIAFLIDLEWARPEIEKTVGQAFHRPVKFGKLSWTLGLNGLAISTDKLSMTEADKRPFIDSGHSEIGIAFLPLFNGRLIIKHVSFERPEVFATQIAPGQWNFSDLLVDGPEIKMLQVKDGRLHLRNAVLATVSGGWQQYDLQDIQLKLIFPKGNQRWPFYLGFKLPREENGHKFTTDIQISALGNGPFDQWQHNKQKIDMTAYKVRVDDLRPFFTIPAGVTGLFEVKVAGEGIPDKGLVGTATAVAHELKLNDGQHYVFDASKASAQAALFVQPDLFQWKDGVVTLAGVKLNSEGQISNWQKPNPRYQMAVRGKLSNIGQISTTTFAKLINTTDSGTHNTELAGNALIEMKIEGDDKKREISTSLKAENVPLAKLMGDRAKPPVFSMLQVDPAAKIKGEIQVKPDERIELKDLEIPAQGSIVHIHGFIDKPKEQEHIMVSADGLNLDKFQTKTLLAQFTSQSRKQESGFLLSGKVDLDAEYIRKFGKQSLAVRTTLKDAGLWTAGQELASGMNGEIVFDGNTVRFEKVSGVLPSKGRQGTFQISGKVSTAQGGECDLAFYGQNVDVARVKAIIKAIDMKLPEGPLAEIGGIAKNIEFKLKGKESAPQIAFSLTPEQMEYHPKNLDGTALPPLHITSGRINLVADDELLFKDLAIQGLTGKITVNSLLTDLKTKPTAKWIKVKTDAITLGEVQVYLASNLVAADVYKRYVSLLNQLQIADVQGTVYGDLSIGFTGKTKIEGAIGFFDVRGKFGETKTEFGRASGLVAASTKELLIQGLTAHVADSVFTIDGNISDYLGSASWKSQIVAQLKPQDVLAVLPELKKWKLSVRSSEPIGVRANVHGNARYNKVIFYSISDPGDNLVATGPFGMVAQPRKESVILDGSVTINRGANAAIQVHNSHLLVGGSVIDGSGRYEWGKDGKPPFLEFMVSSPNPVPAALVVSMIDPAVKIDGTTGSFKGTLAMAGPTDALLTHGNLSINHVSIPSLKIHNVHGTVDSPRWSIVKASQAEDDDALQSRMRVSLPTAEIGGVLWRDLKAEIVYNTSPTPRIALEDATASLSAGTMKADGWYELQTEKSHLNMKLAKLQVDQFVKDLMEKSGQVTGLADASMSLHSKGSSWEQIVQNLDGTGSFNVYSGTVSGVGQLQEKLTQANLLQQGIFGFNFNNLLESVMPSKTGRFKEVSGAYAITNGIVNLEEMRFDGENMRLRAAGFWNLPLNTIDVEVAGDIPRVANSILPGPFGEVSRAFTLQKAFRLITFSKFTQLPSLPILGDIATTDPRAFTFKVAAPLSTPNAVAQSIQRTFKWLPNKPNASAHPIPGM
jgi:hypothetical protein